MIRQNKKDHLKDLYQKMADLTYSRCKDQCNFDAVCCSSMYCKIATEECAKREGIKINHDIRSGNLLLDKDNQCIVPPHCRPMCTLHICDKFLIDPKFYENYFKLRDEISQLEYGIYVLGEF